MRLLLVVLAVVFTVLQYQIWFSGDGVSRLWTLKKSIAQQEQANTLVREQNQILTADLNDLKEGTEAIEERAREDLGMILEGEVFYQIIE